MATLWYSQVTVLTSCNASGTGFNPFQYWNVLDGTFDQRSTRVIARKLSILKPHI